jgi:hypothetical protein
VQISFLSICLSKTHAVIQVIKTLFTLFRSLLQLLQSFQELSRLFHFSLDGKVFGIWVNAAQHRVPPTRFAARAADAGR